MKRIVFLVLWIIPVLGTRAQGGIEIYVNGHKYGSFEAYLASKKTVAANVPVSQKPKGLSDLTLHKFYVLSVEHGVVDALEDFYENWGQLDNPMPRKISSEQLQEAIQEAVSASKDPKLLISEPGKVRIMSMSSEGSNK